MFEDISKLNATSINENTVVHRLVLAIGYRLNRASMGFKKNHFDLKPVDSAMSVGELLQHISDLILFTLKDLGEEIDVAAKPHGPEYILSSIETLAGLVEKYDFSKAKIEKLYLINGPLADCLSHIGQLNTYKRLLNIDSPNSNYFKGEKI